MRYLASHQTLDPGRGSFLVRPQVVKERPDGSRVFVAPTEPKRGEGFDTFSNAVQFIPVQERKHD